MRDKDRLSSRDPLSSQPDRHMLMIAIVFLLAMVPTLTTTAPAAVARFRSYRSVLAAGSLFAPASHPPGKLRGGFGPPLFYFSTTLAPAPSRRSTTVLASTGRSSNYREYRMLVFHVLQPAGPPPYA